MAHAGLARLPATQAARPDRTTGAPPAVLLKQADGLRLLVTADQLDSRRFAALVERSDPARPAEVPRPERRAARDVAGHPGWPEAWLARLTELKAQVTERRLDALIRSGCPKQALPDFDAVVRDWPLSRDRPRVQGSSRRYKATAVESQRNVDGERARTKPRMWRRRCSWRTSSPSEMLRVRAGP